MSYIASLIEMSNLFYEKDLELDHYVQKYDKLEFDHDSLKSTLNSIKEIAEMDTKAKTQVGLPKNNIRHQENKLKVAKAIYQQKNEIKKIKKCINSVVVRYKEHVHRVNIKFLIKKIFILNFDKAINIL